MKAKFCPALKVIVQLGLITVINKLLSAMYSFENIRIQRRNLLPCSRALDTNVLERNGIVGKKIRFKKYLP